MGRVCYGPSLSWAEFVMGRDVPESQTVIGELKSNGKFIHHLLSLEEIPDDFEVEIGKFTLEKFRIVSGSLIDTQNLGFPTLHEVLQSAFLSVSSGLLTIGAICSAVFKTKG